MLQKTAQTDSLADITDIKGEPVEIKRSGQSVRTNKSPFSRSLQINNTASVSVHLPSDVCECGCENKDTKKLKIVSRVLELGGAYITKDRAEIERLDKYKSAQEQGRD